MRFPWDRDKKGGLIVDTQFPDKSLKIGVTNIHLLEKVVARLEGHENIWNLMLLNDILVRSNKKIPLDIKYLMYQQDDRIFDRYESFGLKVLADVLNSLEGFNKISVFDPHSDMVHLIKDVIVENASKQIEEVINYIGKEDLCVVTPDAGAYKKYMPQIPEDIPVYTCSKVRDNQGDVISVTPNFGNERKVLIIDDIGLGCKTHINVAQNLHVDKEKYLYVSHGVFPSGVEHLKQYFKKVFTTNSITKEKETDFLKIIEL